MTATRMPNFLVESMLTIISSGVMFKNEGVHRKPQRHTNSDYQKRRASATMARIKGPGFLDIVSHFLATNKPRQMRCVLVAIHSRSAVVKSRDDSCRARIVWPCSCTQGLKGL